MTSRLLFKAHSCRPPHDADDQLTLTQGVPKKDLQRPAETPHLHQQFAEKLCFPTLSFLVPHLCTGEPSIL